MFWAILFCIRCAALQCIDMSTFFSLRQGILLNRPCLSVCLNFLKRQSSHFDLKSWRIRGGVASCPPFDPSISKIGVKLRFWSSSPSPLRHLGSFGHDLSSIMSQYCTLTVEMYCVWRGCEKYVADNRLQNFIALLRSEQTINLRTN